jgi:cellobiose-specific phosphotransferase system component IIC
VWTVLFLCGTHEIYIYFFFFINWTLRMSDNLPERVKILCHAHIICITVLENRMICCQIFCDLLLKSAFERILNVMQLILVKIKWQIKWKYLIQKFHDIGRSYYFNQYVHRDAKGIIPYFVVLEHKSNMWEYCCIGPI